MKYIKMMFKKFSLVSEQDELFPRNFFYLQWKFQGQKRGRNNDQKRKIIDGLFLQSSQEKTKIKKK